MWTSSLLLEWISVAVVNPIGTSLHAITSEGHFGVKKVLGRSSVEVLTFGQDLVCLGLANSLDCQQRLFRRKCDGFNGIETGILELLGVRCRYTSFLRVERDITSVEAQEIM